MLVRSYRPEDLAAIVRLFTETVHRVNATDYSPEQLAAWAPDPPDVEHWRRRLAGHVVLVAEGHGEIVGFATFETDGHLDHLYVDYRFQRQGVASELLRRIEAEAVTRGIGRIFTEPSITARPFFEHAGFRIVAEQTVEHSGVTFVNYLMEKMIGTGPSLNAILNRRHSCLCRCRSHRPRAAEIRRLRSACAAAIRQTCGLRARVQRASSARRPIVKKRRGREIRGIAASERAPTRIRWALRPVRSRRQMTHAIPVRSTFPRFSSRGSIERNRITAGAD